MVKKENAVSLADCFASETCVILGSGATYKFVGDWKGLLGRMLGRRFVSMWLAEGRDFSEIESFADDECFSSFFNEADNLELGEFLLTDAVGMPTSGSREEKLAWQELLFSRQVSDVLRRKVNAAVGEPCAKKECPEAHTCPLRKMGRSALYELYEDYTNASEFSADGKGSAACSRVKDFAATAAVVELLAAGKARYVINYNFDTVVELMLYEVIAKSMVSSCIGEIHVWTYGIPEAPEVLVPHVGKCGIVFHQGPWGTDIDCLRKPGAIHFFHVHGVSASSPIECKGSQLVFSEHSYRVYQSASLNWSNQVMAYLFDHYNVVGVGFSGADDNFRRFVAERRPEALTRYPMAGSGGTKRVVLIKSKSSYTNAITAELKRKSGKTDSEDLDKNERVLLKHFLQHCVDMVATYYCDQFDIRVVWVDERFDVAMRLHEIAVS